MGITFTDKFNHSGEVVYLAKLNVNNLPSSYMQTGTWWLPRDGILRQFSLRVN